MTITGWQSPLWVGGREFREPVRVDITAGDGEIVAEWAEAGVFGSGPTLLDAIEDFRDACTDHLAALGRGVALSRDLERQRALLHRHLAGPVPETPEKPRKEQP